MYLQQLFRHSKWLFALVVAFAAAQLIINVKQGMVVSPFYHYGMYSEVIVPEQAYEVLEIAADGKRLQASRFTPWQWDRLIWPAAHFNSVNKSNQLYTSEIQRLLGYIHFSPRDQHLLSACNYNQFSSWYKIHVSKITDRPVEHVDIKMRSYTMVKGKLQPGANATPLQELCR